MGSDLHGAGSGGDQQPVQPPPGWRPGTPLPPEEPAQPAPGQPAGQPAPEPWRRVPWPPVEAPQAPEAPEAPTQWRQAAPAYPTEAYPGQGYPGQSQLGQSQLGQTQLGQGYPGQVGPGADQTGPPEFWGLQPIAAPPPEPRRRRRRMLIAIVAVVVLAGGGVTAAYTVPPLGVALGLRPSPRELATKAANAFLTGWQKGDYAAMQAVVLDPKDSMSRVYGGMVTRLKVTKTVVTPGTLDQAGTTMPYTATVSLSGLGDVSWKSVLHLQKSPNGWRVRFTSDTVYPGLSTGQRLGLLTTVTTRGSVVDRQGESLRDDGDLSANLVGKDPVKGSGATGLQRVYNAQLAGTPATRLAVVDATSGDSVNVVKEWNAQPGQDVKTTLDLGMQRAAERALAGVDGRAALVAIDTTTGEVRAMASHPTSGLASAFASYYAPGSTFKIITASAALMTGSTPQSPQLCTPTVTVNGRTFKNAEKAASRTISLTEAFAESCNTAFIRLSQSLPSGALKSAAEMYGFNAGQPLPIASVGGQMPAAAGSTEAAADAIGQGRVEASPLQMASVAAAVASGTWHQPHLIAECPKCASHQLPAAVTGGLHPLMRAVVTSGTGVAAKDVPGEPVYAKTGTAEFGSGTPLPTHAWFVGWQGTTAFAVFVERGAFGGTVAAPIAARFLQYSASA